MAPSEEEEQSEQSDETDDSEASDMSTPKNNSLQLQAAVVVPIHAATAPAKRGPGRPRKINPKPTPDDLAYHAEMQRQQLNFIEQDAVVQAADSVTDSIEILQTLKRKIARSAAALEFQRIELQKYGKTQEATQVVSRQITALREVAAIEAEIAEKRTQTLDLRSGDIQKVFQLFIEKIKEVASETLPHESQDLFFIRLESALEGWEDEAESRLR